MQSFRNILFVVDAANPDAFRDAALQTAELAQTNSAQLTVLDVVEPLPAATALLLKKAVPENRLEAFRQAERRELLEAFTESLRAAMPGVEIGCEILAGTPFVEIIRAAQARGYDLIVKTAQENSIAGQLFGSTDLHLLRKCHKPVWIMKQQQPRTYSRVLAAVDIGEDEANSINNEIIATASAFATANDSELHVLQCWDLPSDNILKRALTKVSPEDKNRMVQLTEKNYHQWIDELLAPHNVNKANIHSHLKQGDPKELIPYMAQKYSADLIVMGTVNRTGLEGFVIGSTAEEVLKRITSSVLAVKPAGFQTPLELPAATNSTEIEAA